MQKKKNFEKIKIMFSFLDCLLEKRQKLDPKDQIIVHVQF